MFELSEQLKVPSTNSVHAARRVAIATNAVSRSLRHINLPLQLSPVITVNNAICTIYTIIITRRAVLRYSPARSRIFTLILWSKRERPKHKIKICANIFSSASSATFIISVNVRPYFPLPALSFSHSDLISAKLFSHRTHAYITFYFIPFFRFAYYTSKHRYDYGT